MVSETVPIVGSTPAHTNQRIGGADPNRRLELTVKLRRSTEEGLPTLEQFMQGQRATGLTRADLATRFGASQEDAQAVQDWALAQRLTVTSIDLAARRVRLAGPQHAVARAFGVSIGTYRHARTGAAFHCPDADLRIPKHLAGIVTGVFGLTDLPVVLRHRHAGRIAPMAQADGAQERPPGTFYPHEVAKLYDFPAATGQGQRVAVLEFGGGFDPAVLADYFANRIGLAATPAVNSISVLGQPNDPADAATGEVYLDIEVIGAAAPDAVIDVYFAPWTAEGFLTAVEEAIRNHDYGAISISWGLDEDARGTSRNPGWSQLRTHVDEAFREAVAVGIAVFVSSGDQGSGCLRGTVTGGDGREIDVTEFSAGTHAAYPASSPYATAVGGTMLYASDGRIAREIVWNELGPILQQDQNQFFLGAATGGAVSHRYGHVPSYQSAAGLAPTSIDDGQAGRGVPDVAANAGMSTGYLVSTPLPTHPPSIGIRPVGGTSAAAPLWAALLLCAREALADKLGPLPAFFFNDFVYACGRTAAFRDITGGRTFTFDPNQGLVPGDFTDAGNNRSTAVDGYSAAPGYDLCTGWGSPNGVELLAQLAAWLQQGPPN
jgi:kumamolisin